MLFKLARVLLFLQYRNRELGQSAATILELLKREPAVRTRLPTRPTIERMLRKSIPRDSNANLSASEEKVFQALQQSNQLPSIEEVLEEINKRDYEDNYDEERKLQSVHAAVSLLGVKNWQNDDVWLSRFLGYYSMFRKNWRDKQNETYMRSLVKISRKKDGTFALREWQNWSKAGDWSKYPPYEQKEYSSGALISLPFESHRDNAPDFAISVMRSSAGTLRFININEHNTNSSKNRTIVNSFSGSALPFSIAPPNPGYGFHCKRIGDLGVFKLLEHHTRTEVIQPFQIEGQVYTKIMQHEGRLNPDVSFL